MKTSLVLLSLAVVAVSNAAVLNTPAERFGMVAGNNGPDDSSLSTIYTTHNPLPGSSSSLQYMESSFSLPTVILRISQIRIIEHTNSGATAQIVSGGVGSDHVTIRFTPFNGQGFSFETEIWGSYTKFGKSDAVPEMITFERKIMTPAQ